jgi:hypothetical protein
MIVSKSSMHLISQHKKNSFMNSNATKTSPTKNPFNHVPSKSFNVPKEALVC